MLPFQSVCHNAPMQKIFTRLLNRVFGSTDLESASVMGSEYQDDIPRYPPFVKGLPRATRERIVHDQNELILKIKQTFNMNHDDFERVVLPVIHNYAGFVHLLPASEAHHHKGAGGLFRHGLEVGYWAAKSINAHEMCVREQPKLKRSNEVRWQLAAFLGGMLHDIGKPLADMQVVDKEGNREWNPYAGFLDQWLYNEDIDRYFLRWRSQRAQRHRKFSTLNVGMILTDEARAFLNKHSPDITEALLESLVGSSMNGTLTKIVIYADSESVKRDLLSQRISADENAYGVPVERYILDCIRRLAAKETRVNCKGAHIWRGEKGVYIAWRQISDVVAQMLKDSGVAGVPTSYETTADIMLENQYAEPFKDANGERSKRFWTIAPEALGGVQLNCLYFSEIGQIFPNEAPPPVPLNIIDTFSAEQSGALHEDENNPVMAPADELIDLERRFDEYNQISAYAEYVDYFDYLANKEEYEDYSFDEANDIPSMPPTEAAVAGNAVVQNHTAEHSSQPLNSKLKAEPQAKPASKNVAVEPSENLFTNQIENYVANSTLQTLRKNSKPIDSGSEALTEALRPKTSNETPSINPIAAYLKTSKSEGKPTNTFNAAEHKNAFKNILAHSKATGDAPRTQTPMPKPIRKSAAKDKPATVEKTHESGFQKPSRTATKNTKPVKSTPAHDDGDDFDVPSSLQELLRQNSDKSGKFKPKDE